MKTTTLETKSATLDDLVQVAVVGEEVLVTTDGVPVARFLVLPAEESSAKAPAPPNEVSAKERFERSKVLGNLDPHQ